MSWKLTGNPKTEKVTKRLAEKFSIMEPAPHDRPLSENRLRVYQKILADGGFRPCAWAAAICKATGATYRVNGKHTSVLFAGADLDKCQELYAVVEYYECDTLEDVARLYATYDSKTQSRTTNDINASFASCVPQLADVDSRTINLAASAIWYSQIQEAAARMQHAERAEALLDHWDFPVFAHKLCGSGNNTKATAHLKRMPVFAAMYSTFVKAPIISRQFWECVRDETGLTPGEPTRKLARFLILNSSKNRRGIAGNVRYRVKDIEFFVKCLHAWNAYRKSETTNLNYHEGAKVPAVA